MTTIYRPPLTVLHDQRLPVTHCVGCGGEGHVLKDCPDETEGRRMYRHAAHVLGDFSVQRHRRRPRIKR